MGLQKFTWDHKGLQEIKGGYRIKGDYKGLLGVTRALQGFTGGYRIKGDYKGL